jgi:hypothetical protein
MTRDATTTKPDEGAGARPDADEGRVGAGRVAASSAFDRTFKYALVAYAVIEFIAIALFVYYKVAR